MNKEKKRKSLQAKFIWSMIIFTIILSLAAGFGIVQGYRNNMEEYYSETAFDQATIASYFIDGDTIANYAKTLEKDEYYQIVEEYLSNVKNTAELEYFYVVIPLEDEMLYIWDAGNPQTEEVCELGDVESYYGGGDEIMHEAFSKDAKRNILITNNQTYGYLASAYVPILDSNGEPVALSSVDISMDKINSVIFQMCLRTLAIVIGLLFIFAILWSVYIRKVIIRPLAVLHAAVQSLVKNNMDNLQQFNIPIHTGDEIEDLADSFKTMSSELYDYIQNLASVTAEKERIGAELGVATQIQADMLPRIFPFLPERPEFDLYASMTPAKEVGGDFYDYFMIDSDHLAIVIGDVSGKGVPAALFMVISKTIIKNYAMANMSPDEVFTKANSELCEGNAAELFTTAWFGIYEISTGKLVFADAGHEDPICRKPDGTLRYVKPVKKKMVLAGFDGIRYILNETSLEKGDTILLYTDGVPEACDGDGEFYGLKRLGRVVEKDCGADPVELLKAVKKDVDEFVGDAPQFDDLTMLALTINL